MTFSTLFRSTLPPSRTHPALCRHTDQCRFRIAHDAAIGINSATVDDGDALVPVGCRSSICTDTGPGLRAGQPLRAQLKEFFLAGINFAGLAGADASLIGPRVARDPGEPEFPGNRRDVRVVRQPSKKLGLVLRGVLARRRPLHRQPGVTQPVVARILMHAHRPCGRTHGPALVEQPEKLCLLLLAVLRTGHRNHLQ